LATWAVAGGILWFLAYQFAPLGYETPFSKTILILVLATLFASFADACLRSRFGGWSYLLDLAFLALLVKVFLRLTFTRSILTSITFFGVMFCVLLGTGLVLRHYNYIPKSAQHTRSHKG
jgi:uncharacterized membrane protein (DUF373 family)